MPLVGGGQTSGDFSLLDTVILIDVRPLSDRASALGWIFSGSAMGRGVLRNNNLQTAQTKLAEVLSVHLALKR